VALSSTLGRTGLNNGLFSGDTSESKSLDRKPTVRLEKAAIVDETCLDYSFPSLQRNPQLCNEYSLLRKSHTQKALPTHRPEQ